MYKTKNKLQYVSRLGQNDKNAAVYKFGSKMDRQEINDKKFYMFLPLLNSSNPKANTEKMLKMFSPKQKKNLKQLLQISPKK